MRLGIEAETLLLFVSRIVTYDVMRFQKPIPPFVKINVKMDVPLTVADTIPLYVEFAYLMVLDHFAWVNFFVGSC